MRRQTQGRRLIAALKRKQMTGMELQMLGISTCWWKRVAESLGPHERLVWHYKRIGTKLLQVYRVVNATRWTV